MDSPAIPARRHYSDRSKPKSYHTAQVRHYSTPAHGLNHVISGSTDNSKENMVQGWLDNIQALGSGVIAWGPTHHTPNESKHVPRPRSVSPARRDSHALPRSRGSEVANSMFQSGGHRRHKRLRASFDDRDDSSVIAPRGFADNPRTRRPRLNPAAEASYYERGKKRSQPGPDDEESGSSPAFSPPTHNFEKRARHKTKSDRYDTVKTRDASKEKKRQKRQKEAMADSKKIKTKCSHLASAREVMDNFSSHSILSDRITIPPSSRPGLFENGRVSKKPVTDLMSNNMSFLKQSRREPQKPPSRRRESENRRAEREREDISAFFLHKSHPDRYDVQGRKPVEKGGFSSHDIKTGDVLSNTPERRTAPNQSRLLSSEDHRHAPSHESSTRVEREQSLSSSCISWSTSRLSTGPREPSMSNARPLSSMPVRIREALTRSGIFDNTGIACDNSHGPQRAEPGEDGHVSARSPSTGQTLGKIAKPGSGQPVRIVHYQDRGTMADEEVLGLKDHAKDLSMQKRLSVSRAEPLDTAESQKSMNLSCVKIPVSETTIGLCQMPSTTMTSHGTQMCDQVVGPDIGSSCFQMASERPKSPKCAVVERLQAAAEDVRPRISPLARSASASAQIDHQLPWSLVDSTIHCPSNAKGSSMGPSLCVPLSAANRLAPDPVLAPVQRGRTSSKPPNSWYPPQLRDIADGISTFDQILQTQFPTASQIPDQTLSDVPIEVQSETVTTHTASTQHSYSHRDHQSMRDYIAELERHILDQTDMGEGSGKSSSKEIDFSLDSDPAEMDASAEHANACLQSDDGLSGPYLGQAPNTASRRNWTAVAELEKDEEQRFMSSFWRPSGYPI